MHRFALVLWTVVTFLAGAAGALLLVPGAGERLLGPTITYSTPPPVRVGGPFSLTAAGGKTVRDTDFDGRYRIVFFGHRADTGLTAAGLQLIAEALARVGPKAADIAPIFITVDGAADPPEPLQAYAAGFHPAIVALGGTVEDLARVTKLYLVQVARSASSEAGEGPVADVVSPIYIFDKKGQYVTHVSPVTPPGQLAAALRALP